MPEVVFELHCLDRLHLSMHMSYLVHISTSELINVLVLLLLGLDDVVLQALADPVIDLIHVNVVRLVHFLVRGIAQSSHRPHFWEVPCIHYHSFLRLGLWVNPRLLGLVLGDAFVLAKVELEVQLRLRWCLSPGGYFNQMLDLFGKS